MPSKAACLKEFADIRAVVKSPFTPLSPIFLFSCAPPDPRRADPPGSRPSRPPRHPHPHVPCCITNHGHHQQPSPAPGAATSPHKPLSEEMILNILSPVSTAYRVASPLYTVPQALIRDRSIPRSSAAWGAPIDSASLRASCLYSLLCVRRGFADGDLVLGVDDVLMMEP